MSVFQDNAASCATTAEFYVNATRREYVQGAVEHLILGDHEAARERMLTCLAIQARVSGIRLERE